MVEISTSILTMEEEKREKTILELETAKTNYYHIDVMDGKFVEKDTYKKMLENSMAIKRLSNIPLDVHLMVEDVKKGIGDFLDVEPNMITFHLEACKNKEEVLNTINLIKSNYCKVRNFNKTKN